MKSQRICNRGERWLVYHKNIIGKMRVRKFLVFQWGDIARFTVIWCKGIKCDECQIRFDCWTKNKEEGFILKRKPSSLNAYEFEERMVLPCFIQPISYPDGARLPMRIENVVEYVIAGEIAKAIPQGQWYQGWVFRGSCQCPTPSRFAFTSPDLPYICSSCPNKMLCERNYEKL